MKDHYSSKLPRFGSTTSTGLHSSGDTQPPIYSYIRQKDVLELIPFSAATLWRRVKADPTFPKPVKLSARITAWSRAEIYAWLQNKGELK